MSMKHLIRKQVINLELDAGQNAFSIQQQLRDHYYQQIAPALERLFDELSSENEIIQFEKLEIHLGDLGWNNDRFTSDKDSIYKILKQSFSKAISASANNLDSHVQVNYRTAEENSCLQWLYYVEKGILPWQVQITDEKWLEEVLHQLAIDHVLIEKTKKLILSDHWFLARLVREHDEDFLQHIVEVITANRHPDLIEKVSILVNQNNKDSAGKHFTKKQIWEEVLRHYAVDKTAADLKEILLIKKKIVPELNQRLNHELIEEGIFCQYAGLILLHPFYRHLFNHLFLFEDGIFKNSASLEKAVVLLYFIATGKTDAKDHELVVPKIFCGMQLHEVISEESFYLSEAERKEALNMMHAAIDQWDIIRNTSVQALRESFLAREGKLLIKDKGIEIRVEARGIDVLLDRLPWNLSLIRFPWLDKLIHVEWR
jgi:hypothetical protein